MFASRLEDPSSRSKWRCAVAHCYGKLLRQSWEGESHVPYGTHRVATRTTFITKWYANLIDSQAQATHKVIIILVTKMAQLTVLSLVSPCALKHSISSDPAGKLKRTARIGEALK